MWDTSLKAGRVKTARGLLMLRAAPPLRPRALAVVLTALLGSDVPAPSVLGLDKQYRIFFLLSVHHVALLLLLDSLEKLVFVCQL